MRPLGIPSAPAAATNAYAVLVMKGNGSLDHKRSFADSISPLRSAVRMKTES